MSTPYQPMREHDRDNTSTTALPLTPVTPVTVPDATPPYTRDTSGISTGGTHPAVQQQVPELAGVVLALPGAYVHGWSKDQRVLQLVSYLDETAMNVAQELGDNELYNYDVLVKLLSDRFDPASRVSAFRSRFHGRSRRHHEDADVFADALAELCRVGYPQSPPELRQELIAEQFVRGQSDPELKKYLWLEIRTKKDVKLQTLIEVCTDFSRLTAPAHLHRPAQQTFAVHQQMETPYAEEDCDLEAVFAVGDRPPWANRITMVPLPGLSRRYNFLWDHA